MSTFRVDVIDRRSTYIDATDEKEAIETLDKEDE